MTAPPAFEHLRTLEGKPWRPEPGRPYLKLCNPCNRRAAEAGIAAELEGVEVCLPCAEAIDRWHHDFATWRSRRARNKRKAEARRRRMRRNVRTKRR